MFVCVLVSLFVGLHPESVGPVYTSSIIIVVKYKDGIVIIYNSILFLIPSSINCSDFS